jgi:hypothetical protein
MPQGVRKNYDPERENVFISIRNSFSIFGGSMILVLLMFREGFCMCGTCDWLLCRQKDCQIFVHRYLTSIPIFSSSIEVLLE